MLRGVRAGEPLGEAEPDADGLREALAEALGHAEEEVVGLALGLEVGLEVGLEAGLPVGLAPAHLGLPDGLGEVDGDGLADGDAETVAVAVAVALPDWAGGVVQIGRSGIWLQPGWSGAAGAAGAVLPASAETRGVRAASMITHASNTSRAASLCIPSALSRKIHFCPISPRASRHPIRRRHATQGCP
jgi:hypothetical protein